MCQACRDRIGVWRKGKDKIQGQEISSICRTLAALLSSCPQHGRILRVQAQEICKWKTKRTRGSKSCRRRSCQRKEEEEEEAPPAKKATRAKAVKKKAVAVEEEEEEAPPAKKSTTPKAVKKKAVAVEEEVPPA